jgi:hypothetical protein
MYQIVEYLMLYNKHMYKLLIYIYIYIIKFFAIVLFKNILNEILYISTVIILNIVLLQSVY